MSAIIYEQTPGALTAQAGRAVTTFQSGLVRVDQTYIGATADAATHRETLAMGNAMPDGNDAPSIETLSIYPGPQEIERTDGFTEFKVSAYGRTAAGFRGIELIQSVSLGTASTATTPDPTYTDVYGVFWNITGFIVMPFGTPVTIGDLEYESTLNDPLRFSTTLQGDAIDFTRINDTRYNLDLGYPDVSHVNLSDPFMTINSQSNFGAFVEINVSVSRGINSTIPG